MNTENLFDKSSREINPAQKSSGIISQGIDTDILSPIIQYVDEIPDKETKRQVCRKIMYRLMEITSL